MKLLGASNPAVWPFCPPPVEHELLSAFLTRTAHRHGLSPQRFCAFHFPGLPIWNRDIDRSSSLLLRERITEFSGLSLERVNAMTLQKHENCFSNETSILRQGVAPWINAIGIYHRLRTRFGLQYCPQCLGELKTYVVPWRLSFTVVCPKHACLLFDRCVRCTHPVVLHKTGQAIERCYNCGYLLSLERSPMVPLQALEKLVRVQQLYLTAIDGECVKIGALKVQGDDFIKGLRCIIDALRATKAFQLISMTKGMQLELMDTSARLNVITLLADAINAWPSGFLSVASTYRVNQRHLESSWLPPDWLKTAANGLPVGTARPRGKEYVSVRQRLSTIQRHKRGDWRAERASLLLSKVDTKRGA